MRQLINVEANWFVLMDNANAARTIFGMAHAVLRVIKIYVYIKRHSSIVLSEI